MSKHVWRKPPIHRDPKFSPGPYTSWNLTYATYIVVDLRKFIHSNHPLDQGLLMLLGTREGLKYWKRCFLAGDLYTPNHPLTRLGFVGKGNWLVRTTPTLLLICSSFSRENGYPLLICSSLSTAQVRYVRYSWPGWWIGTSLLGTWVDQLVFVQDVPPESSYRTSHRIHGTIVYLPTFCRKHQPFM